MFPGGTVTLIAFLMASSFVLLIFTLVSGPKTRLDSRIDDLLGKAGSAEDNPADQDAMVQLARSALPKIGAPLVPSDDEERTQLQARLMHAGLYSRQAMVVFLGVKMLLMICPLLAALAAIGLDLVSPAEGVIGGGLAGALGMIGPSFWLDRKKEKRQTVLRRALPDALDVLVICLEGGLSFSGALQRVTDELATVHPLLADEMKIVQREIQLGRSPGEALRQLGDRSDLEEIRTLASVIIQSDRFGASLVKSLRVHGEILRQKRMQRAEEMAQKVAIKILFPTVLCIFPAMFVVTIGPAAIRLMRVFANF